MRARTSAECSSPSMKAGSGSVRMNPAIVALSAGAQFACETTSQMFGSSLGLDHELLPSDTMSVQPNPGPRTFQDQVSACGETQARPCGLGSACRPDQNSFRLLLDRIGTSDAIPPDVVITSPGDGDYVQPGFKVTVTATDNFEVRRVYLVIDGTIVGTATAPPYEFTTPPIADGQHFVKAVAFDGKNEGSYVTYVTVQAEVPEPPPPPDSGGCAAASGGSFGAGIAVLLLGLRRRRRPAR